MKPKNKGSLVGYAPQVETPPPPPPEETKPKRVRRQKIFVVTAEQEEQIESYCFHTKTSMQALVIEGINLVLRSKGLPELK